MELDGNEHGALAIVLENLHEIKLAIKHLKIAIQLNASNQKLFRRRLTALEKQIQTWLDKAHKFF